MTARQAAARHRGQDPTSRAALAVIVPPSLFGVTEEDMGWQDRAVCAQTDPDAFFPEKGGSTTEAKKVCRGCDVRAECLSYALENDEQFGVWGGLSETERRRLKRAAGGVPTRRPRRPVMLERYRALASRGVPPVVIAEELGVTRRSVHRLAARSREQDAA